MPRMRISLLGLVLVLAVAGGVMAWWVGRPQPEGIPQYLRSPRHGEPFTGTEMEQVLASLGVQAIRIHYGMPAQHTVRMLVLRCRQSRAAEPAGYGSTGNLSSREGEIVISVERDGERGVRFAMLGELGTGWLSTEDYRGSMTPSISHFEPNQPVLVHMCFGDSTGTSTRGTELKRAVLSHEWVIAVYLTICPSDAPPQIVQRHKLEGTLVAIPRIHLSEPEASVEAVTP